MSGKYTSVIDKLPRLTATKSEFDGGIFQEKVDKKKAEISISSSVALAELICNLRDQKDNLDEQMSVVNLELEAVSQLLVDAYEAEGVETVKLDRGPSVSVQMEPQIRVLDKEQFRLWCLDNGMEREMVLPYQTSNGLVKARLLNGEPNPEGADVAARPKIVVRGR